MKIYFSYKPLFIAGPDKLFNEFESIKKIKSQQYLSKWGKSYPTSFDQVQEASPEFIKQFLYKTSLEEYENDLTDE